MQRWIIVGAMVVLCAPVTPVAGNDWVGGAGDNLWNNPNNWLQTTTMWVGGQQLPGPDVFIVPPDATTQPYFGWDDPGGLFYPLTPDPSDDLPVGVNDARFPNEGTTTLIDDTVTDATAYGVRIGLDGASNTLEITGGLLQIGGIAPGETDREGWHLDVGRGFNRTANPDPIARLVMSGGEVETNGLLIPEQFVDESLADPYDTPGLNGEMIMTGGTITARWMNVGQFTGNGNAELSGDAEINLWPSVASNPNNGGHLSLKRNWFINGQPVPTVSDAHLDIRDDAVINIFGNANDLSGSPDQSEVNRYQTYIDDGWLTANNGTDDPVITLQMCPDDGSFDEICLSGMMITITAPEPMLLCDFDANGACNIDDIDALVAGIVAGTNDTTFDLTGDGLVDREDIRDPDNGWLRLAGQENLGPDKSYLEGDVTLDGIVDGLDFIEWNNNKFTSTGLWSLADLDADGTTDGLDFITWNTYKFTSSDSHVVPEPAGWVLVFAILVGWQRSRAGLQFSAHSSRR